MWPSSSPPLSCRFLVAAEPADYVHVYDMEGGLARQVTNDD